MSRLATYLILAILLVVLGAMSYVVERAGKPEPPKQPTAQEAAAQRKAMEERMKQEAEARKKMLQAIKVSQQAAKKGAKAGKPGERPINPTAPPPGKTKNTVPPGALDISEDWFKKRKPGEQGIRELEKAQQEQQTAPTPSPSPKLAPVQPN